MGKVVHTYNDYIQEAEARALLQGSSLVYSVNSWSGTGGERPTQQNKQNETKIQDVFHQENKRQTVLIRVWEKVDPSSLLVELETGIAFMETDSAFSQNTKNRTVM